MDVTCPHCGATWPSDDPHPACPICAGVDPNEGGSPAGPEAGDEVLRGPVTGVVIGAGTGH